MAAWRASSSWAAACEAWALAAWTVYVTNVPVALLSLDEALVLARCRWQIELLFKLWKQEGRIDESRSEQPWRVLCEVYAKLLGMVFNQASTLNLDYESYYGGNHTDEKSKKEAKKQAKKDAKKEEAQVKAASA